MSAKPLLKAKFATPGSYPASAAKAALCAKTREQENTSTASTKRPVKNNEN
jgi:hypothetical protein